MTSQNTPHIFSAHRFLAFLMILLASLAFSHASFALAKSDVDGVVMAKELPKEAQAVLKQIQAGGPFKYKDKDGSEFKNREGELPKKPRGYYREYTVKTSATRDRGPIRIIAGEGREKDVRTSNEYYYTADHYKTFRRILIQ